MDLRTPPAWLLALWLGVACAPAAAPLLEPETSTPAPPDLATRRPVQIGADGFFVLHGARTVVYGLEEEHHRYTPAELDLLIPRLKQLGVSFLVVYLDNRQDDFFYERLEQEGLWVAQELGNVKKRTASPFANTGGVLGTVPDEATVAANLARLDVEVPRLARFRNILFWWMGGELAEREFHTAEGAATVRQSVRRYAEAVRTRDPLGRPFTVSHHYVEALEDAALPFVDFSDLTDFTWFTVATHFHLGDFVADGGWWPVARASEVPVALEPLLARAYELNHRRPVFFAGWYGQAPLLGACHAANQSESMREKWRILSTVPSVGSSAYHLSEWDGNGMPHALFELRDGDWQPTVAGETLRDLLSKAPR